MKKILLATTVLAAAGFTSAANAAEWETGVNGYYYLGLGITDGAGQGGVGVLRDGEVHVNGKLTADNGLTFRARVEIESFTSGDQIDENWGSVSGSFGTLMIGSNDTVVYENLSGIGIIYAPGARIGYADSFGLTTAAIAGGFSATPGVPADALGIHYTTPSFAGFKAFAGYHPSAASDGAADSNNPIFDGGDEVWNGGVSYTGDFGDFSLGLGAGYTDIEGVAGEQLAFAANVGYAGFKLAGFYESGFTGVSDEFGIGAQYATGPWTVGGGYSNGGPTSGVSDLASGWVTYAAAPGVLFTVGVEYADNGPNSDFGGLGFLTLRF